MPSNSLALAGTNTNDANYYNNGYTDPTNYRTPVGTFAASPGPYGTYDMGGDLFQWNETAVNSSSRGVRGGYWHSNSGTLASSTRGDVGPTVEGGDIGFRVASSVAVPEPGGITLTVAGVVGLAVVRLLRSNPLSFSPFTIYRYLRR